MEKLCLGCMQMKQCVPFCEHCGFDERTENQPHQLPMGTLLQNQYLVGKVLGQGGFGITYMGWDQHLSIPVAIKEYFPGGVVQRHTQLGSSVMCANGEAPEVFARYRTRFLKEARTLAQLSGIPEIVQIKSFFPENNTAYIVMEYVEGITLKDHLKNMGRPMTEPEALEIMEPVLKALQKVHDHGLIHRDISPDNIMLPKKGGVKLIDFGTVRYMDDSGKSKSTEAVLKPGFAPMEQYNSRGNLGTWTDVYAICATFHYLLTGKVPEDVHDRLEQGEILKPLRSKTGISKQLIAALEKGMKIRSQERLQTVGELYRLLYTSKRKTPVKKQPKETKLKKKIGWLAACAAAVIAAAVLLIPQKQEPTFSIQVPETTEATTPTTTVPETTLPELSPEERSYREAEALEDAGEYGKAAIAFGKLGDYADSRERSFALWETIAHRETLPTNWTKQDNRWDKVFVALKNDGTVLSAFPQVDAVTEWTDIVAIECGAYPQGSFVMGLKKDGSVITTAADDYVELDTSNWSDIVAIDVRGSTAVGLKSDGTVVATGSDAYGQCNVNGWSDIVSVSTTGECTIGLKVDGSVVACGNGSTNVSDWKDIASISTSGSILGIKTDGTILTTNTDLAGKWDVSGWTDIIAADTAYWGAHIVGLRSDGTVVATGLDNEYNKIQVYDWTDIVEVYTTDKYTIGLKSDGTVVGTGMSVNGCLNVSSWTDIVAIRVWYGCTVGLKSDGTVVYAGQGHRAMQDWLDIKLPN